MLCTLGFAGDLGFERNAPFAFAVVCACGVNIWHCEKTVRIRIQLLRMKKEQIAVRERTKPRRQLAAFTTFMVDCCDSLCYQQQQNHSCLTRLLIAKSGDPRRNLLGAVVHWRRETHTHHYCLEKSLLCVIVVWDCGRLWSIRATWQYPPGPFTCQRPSTPFLVVRGVGRPAAHAEYRVMNANAPWQRACHIHGAASCHSEDWRRMTSIARSMTCQLLEQSHAKRSL
jgi:hypothetical protein